MVPDSDIYGKAIQCFLNYVEGSAKQSYIGNSRGKKVHVFANHNEIVSKEPKVAGSWPKKDIEAWLADAGHEPAPAPAPPTTAVEFVDCIEGYTSTPGQTCYAACNNGADCCGPTEADNACNSFTGKVAKDKSCMGPQGKMCECRF